MSMLSRVSRRFEIDLTVEGSGLVYRGMIDEPPGGEPPAQRFNNPRRLLHVRVPSPAAVGQIIRSPGGAVYLLSEHGLSESRDQVLFAMYRLFVVTDRLVWKRRHIDIHPVSKVKTDGPLVDMGLAVGSLEPDRVTFDKGFEASWGTYFTTNASVQADDLVGERKVIRADRVLGLTLCELQ